jgi:hypothetical protein
MQGLDSFLNGSEGKSIEYVCSALQQALSAASDDYTLSNIRRCLDQLHGECVDGAVINLVQPARGYVGTTGCQVNLCTLQNAPPTGCLRIELSSGSGIQVSDTGDPVHKLMVKQFPADLPRD